VTAAGLRGPVRVQRTKRKSAVRTWGGRSPLQRSLPHMQSVCQSHLKQFSTVTARAPALTFTFATLACNELPFLGAFVYRSTATVRSAATVRGGFTLVPVLPISLDPCAKHGACGVGR
jgi:hypothetical protein